MTSLLPTPEPADPVEGASGHFEHTNWVKASLKALDAGTMRSAGDVPVLGDLIVDKDASTEAHVRLRGLGIRSVTGEHPDVVPRWQLVLGDDTAESGSNVGSRFKLKSYSDAGLLQHTVLEADRVTGLLTVAGAPTAANGVATKEYVDQSMPIGAIIAYGGSATPAGWHLCNGTAHGSAALQAVLGSPNTPDLSGRFIVGTGTGYAPGATGGVETVTLTAAQSGMVGHSHSASSGGESQEHTHSIDPPATNTGTGSANHSHTATATESGYHQHAVARGTAVGTGATVAQGSGNLTTSQLSSYEGMHSHPIDVSAAGADHVHTLDIAPFNSGGRSAQHSHPITVTAVSAANASQAHENRPPYYALVYIIRKG